MPYIGNIYSYIIYQYYCHCLSSIQGDYFYNNIQNSDTQIVRKLFTLEKSYVEPNFQVFKKNAWTQAKNLKIVVDQ